ncbi:MAG TPA: (deoxy)nucleoside triphosphate pyrophosphohydrolase [Draconibacterium sp.]|nr:(deoxy)nucleoside triphosphate pyrophosphohydrolase [Draconibacterium sp.]HRX12289.1 (deoxy)nucleoside triphosphate pyrophosphohydrolase [Draconibacterium sp.]
MIKVTCAIIINNSGILTAQRKSTSNHPLKWEFPGGKLNTNETPEDCIFREIREELDIEIEIKKPMISVVHFFGTQQIELIPFLCTVKSGEIKLIEHRNFLWVGFDDLHQFDFIGADRKLIQHPENKSILKKYFRENMHKTR